MLKELGLYVHIPFCIKKCNYCDFNSFCGTDQQKEEYTLALLDEISNMENHLKGHYLNTIFFGGGTPSVLGGDRIKRIMDRIKLCFYIDDEAEITIEINPKTVSFSDLIEYKKMGINRVSVGVQSLSDNELSIIGRSHNLKDFFECYASLKLAGFENINYDLIFGLPNQTLNDFLYTVKHILKYEPTHISCYSLQLEKGTRLYDNQDEFNFASDEENRHMYYKAREIFQENGYMQYEISNFAKRGCESKHNLKYWELKEYLGIGLGASSFFNGIRFTAPDTYSEYINYTKDFKPLWENQNKQSKKELMSEFMFLGLRKTDGVLDSEFKKLFDKSFFDVYESAINKHITNGLLLKDEDSLRLSNKGMDISNMVLCDFV